MKFSIAKAKVMVSSWKKGGGPIGLGSSYWVLDVYRRVKDVALDLPSVQSLYPHVLLK